MAQPRAISSPAPAPNPLKAVGLSSVGELAVPIAVLLIVIALITPLPSFILDILIVLDLMMSVIVMMGAMIIGRPVFLRVREASCGGQLYYRRRHFLRPYRHSIRRHQPRFGAHLRSHRAL